MLKLMIVDDESLFREALKISLPWESLGYTVCCEAENGFDALEKIAEYKPDVALVDINMPVMDGLELAAEIKEKELDVKVIIITGYDEFAYARQAIEVGAGNYLLKPIDEAELTEALLAIKSRIAKERSARMEAEALAQQVNDYRPVLKELLLNDLLRGNSLLGEAGFSSLSHIVGVGLDSGAFQAAVIQADGERGSAEEGGAWQLWWLAVGKLVGTLLEEYCPVELCRDIQGRLNVLLLPENDGEELQMNLVNAFERVRITASRSFGVSLTVGLGRPYGSLEQLALSYKEALYALRSKSVAGEGCVIACTARSDEALQASFFPIEMKMQLHICLRGGDIGEAEKIVRAVFDQIRSKNPAIDAARLACIELGSALAEAAGRSGLARGLAADGAGILEEAMARKDLDGLEAWILGLLAEITDSPHAGAKRPSKIVEDAIAFINDNYMRFDLRIDSIAKNVYVRYGHLCFLFKRETGKTINEYLSELRIQKARELIDGGCRSISLVAAKVGYADANYFGKCFKKLTGITPAKYVESFSAGKN